VIHVTNRPNVHVRLLALKLTLGHLCSLFSTYRSEGVNTSASECVPNDVCIAAPYVFTFTI
jgi:hypothetical protein